MSWVPREEGMLGTMEEAVEKFLMSSSALETVKSRLRNGGKKN
jgi:hypothetical protein